MSYIGTPPSNAFTSLLKQDFSTSATTGYTLDHAVNNANDIALFINFVRQEPTAGYAASGTTLTLTSATASSDDMYCVYLGQALQTVNPANASVGSSQLSPTAITGQTALTSVASDDTVLISDTSASGALKKMTRANFVSGIGGTNTPAWLVRANTNQTLNDSTATGLGFGTEYYDTANGFASDKFTVPSGQDGKYQIYYNVNGYDSGGSLKRMVVYLYLNGSSVAEFTDDFGNNVMYRINLGGSIALDLSAGNYLQIYALLDTADGSTAAVVGSSEAHTYFGGYKIIE